MTNVETLVFATRINKSNIEEVTRELERGKIPAGYYHTTEGKRELREGDFVLFTESVVELMNDVELEGVSNWSPLYDLSPLGVFSKSRFKKHFGSRKQSEGIYIITSDRHELV